jgi:PAS domain S-box-containing protein
MNSGSSGRASRATGQGVCWPEGDGKVVEFEDLKAMWLDLRAHVDRLAGELEQYVDFFEQASEAYVVTDPDGAIVEVNGPAVDVLLRRRRALRGRSLPSLVALDRRPDFRRRMRALAAGAAHAETAWRTIFESPGLRTDVELAARRIEREGRCAGICWRLEAVQ